MTRGLARLLGGMLLLAPGLARAAGDPALLPVASLDVALGQAEKTPDFAKRYALLAPVVDGTFDLAQILRSSVGLKWDEFSDADKAALSKVFRAFTICNYAANFGADSGDKFVTLPDVRIIHVTSVENHVVDTEIVPKEGDPVKISYVMRLGDAGWRAVDVLQQGVISQAAVQRSDFRALLEAGGAAKLVESLTAKVRELSGGAVTP